MISEIECDLRASALLLKWRNEAGMTQAEVAEKIGYTRKTVSTIELGETHLKLYTLFQWADITKHDVDTAISEIKGTIHSSDMITVKKNIFQKINSFTDDMLKGINFIFHGSHNSNLRAFIHLCSAYLHLPLRDKHMLSMLIIHQYENAVMHGDDVCHDEFKPDLKLLEEAYKKGRQAFLDGENTYYLK